MDICFSAYKISVHAGQNICTVAVRGGTRKSLSDMQIKEIETLFPQQTALQRVTILSEVHAEKGSLLWVVSGLTSGSGSALLETLTFSPGKRRHFLCVLIVFLHTAVEARACASSIVLPPVICLPP